MKIKWIKCPYTMGWKADVGDNVTLVASPSIVVKGKPKRGTSWSASASQWDASTRTLSRYGRDAYMIKCKSYREAMHLAECIYNEEKGQ